MANAVILFTTCTNRKKWPVPPSRMARNLPAGSPRQVASEWIRRMQHAEDRVPAEELYCGRGFREAEATVKECGAELLIISAGYGLVRPRELLGAYSLTVSGNGPDSIRSGGSGQSELQIAKWWLRLNALLGRPYPLSTTIKESKSELFVVAVSAPYLELVSSDLDQLEAPYIRRLRIIGPQMSAVDRERKWAAAVMPYDARLEGAGSNWRGTRADFPQRAARHFLQLIDRKALGLDVSAHREMVEASLSKFRVPCRVTRSRFADSELREVINELWVPAEGRVGRALRLLRDSRKIACEQSRFKRLFWEVAESRGLKHGAE